MEATISGICRGLPYLPFEFAAGPLTSLIVMEGFPRAFAKIHTEAGQGLGYPYPLLESLSFA